MQPVFRILGPLEVALEERTVALGRRERAFLGVLLLYAGEVVSVERLIDGVWGETPPRSAKHMVHEYVFGLRNALGVGRQSRRRSPVTSRAAPMRTSMCASSHSSWPPLARPRSQTIMRGGALVRRCAATLAR